MKHRRDDILIVISQAAYEEAKRQNNTEILQQVEEGKVKIREQQQ